MAVNSYSLFSERKACAWLTPGPVFPCDDAILQQRVILAAHKSRRDEQAGGQMIERCVGSKVTRPTASQNACVGWTLKKTSTPSRKRVSTWPAFIQGTSPAAGLQTSTMSNITLPSSSGKTADAEARLARWAGHPKLDEFRREEYSSLNNCIVHCLNAALFRGVGMPCCDFMLRERSTRHQTLAPCEMQ